MKITDEDLLSLGNLQNLTNLNLAGTAVTGRGLRFLRRCHSLKNLILDRIRRPTSWQKLSPTILNQA